MLLAGEAALLAPALIYSLEEGKFLQVEVRQGKAMDVSFYFLRQVVILFKKQKNQGKTKKNTTSPSHHKNTVRNWLKILEILST